jgi:hypothetical protein
MSKEKQKFLTRLLLVLFVGETVLRGKPFEIPGEVKPGYEFLWNL